MMIFRLVIMIMLISWIMICFDEVILMLVFVRKLLVSGFMVLIIVWLGDILYMFLKLFIVVIDLFRFLRRLWIKFVVDMFLKWILL